MLLLRLLVTLLLASLTLAAPLDQTNVVIRVLEKRSNPDIRGSFTKEQQEQLENAMHDALVLSSYVVHGKPSIVNPIMSKYFNAKDFPTVKNDTRRATPYRGSDYLSIIEIVKDYPLSPARNSTLSCSRKGLKEELCDFEDSYPKFIICDHAFTSGRIDPGAGSSPEAKVSPPPVSCDKLDRHVSERMLTLGATLLSEYTRSYRVMSQVPMPRGTNGKVHSAYGVQHMPKVTATLDADSYSWLATEVYWTIQCKKQYLLALPDKAH